MHRVSESALSSLCAVFREYYINDSATSEDANVQEKEPALFHSFPEHTKCGQEDWGGKGRQRQNSSCIMLLKRKDLSA